MNYLLGEERTLAIDVVLNDISDPDNVVQVPVDFISAGYSDGDKASDLAKGQHVFSMIDERNGGAATITVDGADVAAMNIPFVVSAEHPTINLLKFNGPKLRGTYQCRVLYQKTGGANTAKTEWEEIWR